MAELGSFEKTASLFRAEDKATLFASIATITDASAEGTQRWAAVEALGACAQSGVRSYQAQAVVLDKDVPEAIESLINFASTRLQRDCGNGPPRVHRDDCLDAASAAVYEICSARGIKAVMRLFPHDVRDLEPCYHTLLNLDSAEIVHGTWRTRYALLLWLRMLVMNPFDVDTIVSGSSFVGGVVQACTDLLEDAGPTRDAAALCVAAVLTRRDVKPHHLDDFVKHTADVVASLSGDHRSVFAATGALAALAAAFKAGARSRMRDVAPRALSAMEPCFDSDADHSRALKKAAIKLTSRIGCALLKPRVATWTYSRGRRDLMSAVAQGATGVADSAMEDEDLGEAPPELLEEVVDHLLVGNQDAETKTRWSAAKGIGRVASRLSRDVADDIVGCILDVFQGDSGDEAWHGACLALAECARLGVLLPSRFGDAIDALSKALYYDAKLKSTSSNSGANVRDAACYVAWTFARAFEPEVVQPFLERLSVDMVLVALFDRELHVRRAASAALQENVGRQGLCKFARGLDLLTLADFFALANREHAYVVVAPKIAALGPPYDSAVEAHVVDARLNHWDPDVRAAAARCVGKLSHLSGDFARRTIATLASRAQSQTLSARHGALLGCAEATKTQVGLDASVVKVIVDVVPALEAARLYRGRGGEMVRVGACRLIECIALAKLEISVPTQLRLLDSLDESVVNAVEDVRDAAFAGIAALTWTYFGSSQSAPSDRLLQRTLLKYVSELKASRTASLSRGWARALGSLPRRILCATPAALDAAVSALISRARRDDKVGGARDAETRRDALRGLRDVVSRLDVEMDLSPQRTRTIFEAYVHSSEDYGVDKRGDVGSWARAEALLGLYDLGLKTSKVGPPSRDSALSQDSLEVPGLAERTAAFLDGAHLREATARDVAPPVEFRWTCFMAEAFVGAALRQAGEKLDSVRHVALRVLHRGVAGKSAGRCSGPLQSSGPYAVAAVPCRSSLISDVLGGKDFHIDEEAQPEPAEEAEEEPASMKETDDAHLIYAKLCDASELAPYHVQTVTGLVASAGQGALNNAALLALTRHAQKLNKTSAAAAARLLETLLGLVTGKSTRMGLPALKALAVLLDAYAFNSLCCEAAAPKSAWTEERAALAQQRAGPDDSGGAARTLALALAREGSQNRTAKDVRKCCALADALLATVLFSAANAPTAARAAVVALLRLLTSPYPRARAHVAEQLYARLVELDVDVGGAALLATSADVDAVQEMLGEQQWDGDDVDDMRVCALRLAQKFGVDAEYSKLAEADAATAPKAAESTDELESYAYLVKDAGY